MTMIFAAGRKGELMMNKIPLSKKYYSGMDIHNVISHSDLEYEKMMEIFKKFADLPGAEGEWIALTPVEAAKELSIISPAPAVEFMWFCDYIKKAGLAICKKR